MPAFSSFPSSQSTFGYRSKIRPSDAAKNSPPRNLKDYLRGGIGSIVVPRIEPIGDSTGHSFLLRQFPMMPHMRDIGGEDN